MDKSRRLQKLEHFKAWNPPAAALVSVAAQHEVEGADTLTHREHIVTWICALIAAGQFTNPDIPARLDKQAAGFVDFVEKLRVKKLR